MDIPTMKTWVDGETVTPQDFNEQIRDVGNFVIGGRPFLRLAQRTTPQNMPSGNWAEIVWDTEEADTDNMWDPVSPTLITIQASGIYMVTGGIVYTPSGNGSIRVARVELETGGAVVDTRVPPVGATFTTGVTTTTVAYFAEGTQFNLRGYHDHGSDLPTVASAAQECSLLSVIWLGS